MDGITMLRAASILLLLTAGGGGAMAFWRFNQKRNPPDWLAMAHGFLAAAAFTLIVYVLAVNGLEWRVTMGLLLLSLAAVVGVVLNLLFHLAHKLLPAFAVHAHIAAAVVGTALICWGAWAF